MGSNARFGARAATAATAAALLLTVAASVNGAVTGGGEIKVTFGTPAPPRPPRSAKRVARTFPPMTFGRTDRGIERCDDIDLEGGGVPQDDMVLLTDATGSMGEAIMRVREQLAQLIEARNKNSDTHFAVASYRDDKTSSAVESFEYSWKLHQGLTSNRPALQRAIDSLQADKGGDMPEANLVALHKLATGGEVKWRKESRRLVAWFGDAVGHEPACATDGKTVLTRSSVLAALKAARISVLAVSFDTWGTLGGQGLDGSVDSKVVGSGARCSPRTFGIEGGQASFLTRGTKGKYLEASDVSATLIDDLLDKIEKLDVVISAYETPNCKGVFSVTHRPSLPLTLKSDGRVTLRQCIKLNRDACDAIKSVPFVYVCKIGLRATGAEYGSRVVSWVDLPC